MKPILLFIVVLFSVSCSPESRLERLVKRHPERNDLKKKFS
jgi:dephospho-CoA kinase